MLTTTIGAYPKPDYLALPDWFNIPAGPDTADPTGAWKSAYDALGADASAIVERAVREVIDDQLRAGIDIPTDGEIVRENYIHYHCRHLDGFDFEQLTRKQLRNGAYAADLPTITGPVKARAPFLPDDWRRAQAHSHAPIKVTIPGPMTIADTTVDNFYDDDRKLGKELAQALNAEVLALVKAGCKHIQLDEPLFARKSDGALAFGIENVERVFHGCPDSVVRTVHICCGYPDRLDNPDYPKAPREAYATLAGAMDDSPAIMAVSLEDAHRPNDLALLERFRNTRVILGVVAIAKSRIESPEEIRERLKAALNHIDSERLLAAPDCGLGLLNRESACAKLTHLCQAAHSL